jgi:uridine kinase
VKLPHEVITAITALPLPKIIGVSGFGGAGKSSFARLLAAAIEAPVVGVDSLLKAGTFNTQYRLWEIVDFDRLEREVLYPFLNKEKLIRYGQSNIQSGAVSNTTEVANKGQLIVEGVGLFRPKLAEYWDYKIWIDCPLETAILRGKKRDREEYHQPSDEYWDGIWRDNDIQYLETFKPKEKADLIIANK